ncbi:MAG: METTL5 family protein [Euryarchaeota archaeon]|nr:METTL5 family protein [Euryarchaeota archaeon]
MKQRKLEMLLEDVAGFKEPDPAREQYATPAVLAAEILHFAFMKRDLRNTVYDLGCGTGILAIGARLLGAERVVGYDCDPGAIKIARGNAEKFGVDVDFVCTDVEHIQGHARTVVMNPPFGAQSKGNDRPFLLKALDVSDKIYSIHNKGSHDFIERFIRPATITEWYTTGFPIKRTFKFHKKDVEQINVEIYRIEHLIHR